MKRPILTTVLALLVPIIPSASALFFTDFESDAVGATTAADPAEVTGFFANRAGGIIRDSSVNAPFGASNQYLQFSGENSRAIVSGVSTQDYTDSLVGVSVDFFDAGTGTAGFGTRFGLGTGEFADTQDLNRSGSLFSIRFRTSNGTINLDENTSVVSGALGSYSMGTAYRINYIFNLTSESQLVETAAGDIVDLAPMQAAFGMQDLNTENFFSNAILESSGAINTTIAMVFRNFSGDQTIAYYDNLSISHVAAIPEPSTYAAMFGLGALVLVALRRRLKLAR
jgi:hypothetical protein